MTSLEIIKDELERINEIALEVEDIELILVSKALSVAVTTLESYKDAIFEVDGKIYKIGSKADLSITTIANILSGGKDGK